MAMVVAAVTAGYLRPGSKIDLFHFPLFHQEFDALLNTGVRKRGTSCLLRVSERAQGRKHYRFLLCVYMFVCVLFSVAG